MKKILNNKGFSLVESVLVIIIFSIIVLIWGFYGRDHMKIAMMNEGRMLIEKIVGQEKMYMSEKGSFIKTPGDNPVNKMDELFIDTRTNKYYKTFKITTGPDILLVDLYPNTEKYPDLNGFSVRGVYKTINDKIEYHENYG